MTPAQTNRYHARYLRWHAQQERMALRMVSAGMGRILATVLGSLNETSRPQLAGVLDQLITDAAIQQVIERIYVNVGLIAAEREYDRLLPRRKGETAVMLTKERDPTIPSLPNRPKPPTITINPFSPDWRRQMTEIARRSETAKRVTQMTMTTRQHIRDALTRGAENAWGLPRLVREIRNVVLDKARALLIARTETTRAANAGHEIGAMATRLVLDKRWVATADIRTRPAHLAMLSQKPIGRDELFNVGGLPMKYPGDPAGGAENVCNCRCVALFIPRQNLN